jgi:hypothetical protein
MVGSNEDNMLGISWMAEQVLACREGLTRKELDCNNIHPSMSMSS